MLITQNSKKLLQENCRKKDAKMDKVLKYFKVWFKGDLLLRIYLTKIFWGTLLMLKLKFQYFGHLIRRANSLALRDVGKDWGQEEKGVTEDDMVGWHHQLNGHWVWRTGKPGILQLMGSQRVRLNWVTKQQQI